MKKLLRTLTILIMAVMLLPTVIACTYIENGHEWQDVEFTISYTDENGEDKEMQSILSLSVNFTEQTTKRVKALIEEGFYNDTALVYDYNYDYVHFGSFKIEDGEYVDLIKDVEPIKGEFEKGGIKGSNLRATAGSIVMVRNEDSEDAGAPRYDTATYKFVLLLNNDNDFNYRESCVFGKIDDDTLEALTEIVSYTEYDSDDKTRCRYLGDRDTDKGNLILNEDGKSYQNALDYYIQKNATDDFYAYYPSREPIKYSDDQETYERISGASEKDLVVIPKEPVIVKNFKLK